MNKHIKMGISMFYKIISWKDVEILMTEHKCILIDVRDKYDYDAGHVHDAVNIDMESVVRYVGEQSRDTYIIIYCERGGRSFRAARYIENKYGDKYMLYVVSGGIKAYKYH